MCEWNFVSNIRRRQWVLSRLQGNDWDLRLPMWRNIQRRIGLCEMFMSIGIIKMSNRNIHSLTAWFCSTVDQTNKIEIFERFEFNWNPLVILLFPLSQVDCWSITSTRRRIVVGMMIHMVNAGWSFMLSISSKLEVVQFFFSIELELSTCDHNCPTKQWICAILRVPYVSNKCARCTDVYGLFVCVFKSGF